MPLSDPQNWGKEKEGPEGENAHHRPRSWAQRDHSPEKEAGLPGWRDGPKTLQATAHQAPPELAAHRPFDPDVYPRNYLGRH